MSILDKPLAVDQQRRRKRWPFFLLGPLVLLFLLLLFIGPSTDATFLQHFFTAPKHFTYSGHSDYVSDLAWSPDGKRIASASGDHTVQVWNASDGSHALIYRGHSQDVSALAWSPNGKYIVSGDINGETQIWDATTGQRLFTYRGHTSAVFSLSWSPDSQQIASASADGSLQVWQALSGALVFEVQNAAPLHVNGGARQAWDAVAWSPNGKYIAGGSYGNAQIFDARTGKLFSDAYGNDSGMVHAIAWSPDSQYIATAQTSGDVLVWNVASKQNVFTHNGSPTDVYSVAWSPDGKRIASGGNDALVAVWDALSGQHSSLYRGHADVYPGHFTSNAAVNAIAWSPNGKYIASGGNDNTVQVWQPPAA
jgi:WD40 repeat protein